MPTRIFGPNRGQVEGNGDKYKRNYIIYVFYIGWLHLEINKQYNTYEGN
jgi:hypothetical protein